MKKRPRRVGLGMKSREVSADVVQQEVPEKAVSEVVVGEPEGGGLDLSPVQILDSEYAEVGEMVGKEATVAELQAFEPQSCGPAIQVDPETANALDAMIAASKEERMAEVTRSIMEDGKQYAIGIDRGNGEDKSVAAIIKMGEDGAPDELIEILDMPNMGQLPNGEYRATVRVPEGYIEGIKAQAEADNQSLEDWLSFQLQERLEQWFFAVGAK
jgi:hypothetical protein